MSWRDKLTEVWGGAGGLQIFGSPLLERRKADFELGLGGNLIARSSVIISGGHVDLPLSWLTGVVLLFCLCGCTVCNHFLLCSMKAGNLLDFPLSFGPAQSGPSIFVGLLNVWMNGEKEGLKASGVETLQGKGRGRNRQYGDPLCLYSVYCSQNVLAYCFFDPHHQMSRLTLCNEQGRCYSHFTMRKQEVQRWVWSFSAT